MVLVSVLLLTLGLETFAGGLADEGSALRRAAGMWGGTVSGLFLVTAEGILMHRVYGGGPRSTPVAGWSTT